MLKKILTYLAVILAIFLFAPALIGPFGNSLSVHCVRPPGKNPVCQMRKELLGKFPSSIRTVSDIVDVQKVRSGCSEGCTYRAELITASGAKEPVNEVWTDNDAQVAGQVNGIKAILDGSASSFDYREDAAWWVVWLVVGLVLMVVVMLVISLTGDLLKRRRTIG